LRLLAGPSGCFQHAPGTHTYQARLCSENFYFGGTKTGAPATSADSSSFGVPGGSCFFSSSQSGFRSATVT